MAAAVALPACAGGVEPLDAVPEVQLLRGVQSWAVQLQGAELTGAASRLENARVDMLVIDPMRSIRDMSGFATRELVHRLNKSPGRTVAHKRVVAYLNVGQAEDYRSYWGADWAPRIGDREGRPSFVLGADPDGWEGNYQVAYWDSRWRRVLFGDDDAMLDQILADGFDGIYLDWILACRDPQVVAAAVRDGVDPARAMVDLIAALRGYARAHSPLFVVIAQNGVDLGDQRPEFYDVIDGFAHEDLSFHGAAGAGWNDPAAGDAPAPLDGEWSTRSLAERLRRFTKRGVPVFTLDYALRPDHVQQAEQESRRHGFVPFVSRTPLDRLPDHVF